MLEVCNLKTENLYVLYAQNCKINYLHSTFFTFCFNDWFWHWEVWDRPKEKLWEWGNMVVLAADSSNAPSRSSTWNWGSLAACRILAVFCQRIIWTMHLHVCTWFIFIANTYHLKTLWYRRNFMTKLTGPWNYWHIIKPYLL